MADLTKVVEEIEKLTVLELNELVKMLEEKFGVSAAAQVMASGPAVASAEEQEEKTEFNIELKEVGPNKIAVIKVVKDITGLGLGESKALVDNAPSLIKESVSTAQAKEMEAKLKEAGAVVVLK